VTSYIVEWGESGQDASASIRVTGTTAELPELGPRAEVRVSGVNERGARSWDWARAAAN
jgi:hypothetical protein